MKLYMKKHELFPLCPPEKVDGGQLTPGLRKRHEDLQPLL